MVFEMVQSLAANWKQPHICVVMFECMGYEVFDVHGDLWARSVEILAFLRVDWLHVDGFRCFIIESILPRSGSLILPRC